MSYDYSKFNIGLNGVNGVSSTSSSGALSEVEQNYFSQNSDTNSVALDVKYDIEDENIQNIIYETLNNQIVELESQYNESKNSNGWISGAWDWVKNTFNFGASSNKALDEINKAKDELKKFENKESDLKEVYKNITGRELTSDEIELLASGELTLKDSTLAGEKLYNYTQGQQMSVDVVADIASGIVSVGVVALGTTLGICAAPFTAGASLGMIGAGIGLAATSGAVVKTALKASDCLGNEKEYTLADFGYDTITGSINGAMGPISNALGGAGGTAVMKALGCEALETTTKSLLGQTSAKLLSRAVDCAIDGGLSGATDGFSRALAEGRIEDIPKDMLVNSLGGVVASPLIDGGFNLFSKIGNKIGNSIISSQSDVLADTLAKQTSDLLQAEMAQEVIEQANKELGEAISDEVSDIIQKEVVEQATQEITQTVSKETSEIIQEEATQQIVQELSDEAIKENAQKKLLSTLDFEQLKLSQDNLDEALDSAYYLAELYEESSAVATDDIERIFSQLKSVKDVDGRPKSFESTFKKITNKFQDGKISSLDVDTAYEAVSDALGTRVQMKSIGVNEAKEVIEEAFSDTDVTYEQFIAYMNGNKAVCPEEIVNIIEGCENYVVDELKAIQNNEVYEALLNAIKNNEITITEFNNYGNGEISYFTNSQLAAIAETYYDVTGEKLNIVTKKQSSQIGLIDEFNSGETQYAIINNDKAIKSSGYGSAQMNILHELPDNSIGLGELQIRGTELNAVADVEHIPYDIRTGKISKNDPKYSSVYKVVKSLSDDAYKKYNEYLNQVYKYTRLNELGLMPSGDNVSDLIMKEPKIQDFMSKFGLSDEELYKLSIEGLSELKKAK